MNRQEDLHQEHTTEAIARRIDSSSRHSYLGDFVLGAVDGGVTTFAIVAGAAGAGLSNGIALVLGISNVLADGFSMAASNYLRARSDQQIVAQYRAMEERHIDNIPEGEREEVRQIFRVKGFEGDVLEQIVRVITEDRQQWVNTMLREEWGLQLESAAPWKAASITLLAFVLAGCIPLLPLFANLQASAADSFTISAVLTGVTFAAIGFMRGRTVNQSPLWSAVETLCLGGLAAALAFIAGRMLENLATP